MAHITSQQEVDMFYPILNLESPFTQMGLMAKIRNHLHAARRGDRERESRLINRLGSLRRSSASFNGLTLDLQTAVKDAVKFLRSEGRKVDFKNPDPALWITTRSGQARW